jgi:hypothetical protein
MTSTEPPNLSMSTPAAITLTLAPMPAPVLGQADAPPSALPGLLLALGVAAVGISIWVSLRKKLKNGFRAARETSAEKILRVRAQAQAHKNERDRVNELMVDAEELARRLAALLDSKAERVERLLDRAEARLAELEDRERALREGDAASIEPKIETRRVEPAPPTDDGAAPDAIRYESDDPVAVDIYRLADEGKTPVEIAKSLGEHTGKVELILALRD